jgi:Flagellar biosynthesis protein, FliO
LGIAGTGVTEGAMVGGVDVEPGSGLAGSLLGWLRSAGAAALRRSAGVRRARATRRMELVETLHLGGRRQLLLVACEGRRYLVGAGGDSVQSIAELREDAGVGAGVGVSRGVRAEVTFEDLRCCP